MNKLLSPDVVQGIIRALMATVGGSLIAKGHASQAQLDSIAGMVSDPVVQGGFIAIATIAWSFFHKQQQAANTAAASAPKA